MEELLKHSYILSKVFRDYRSSKYFSPIPEKYKRFHEDVLMLRIYEMFSEENCYSSEKMEEIFVPNFAFMIRCILGHNSLAVELYDLGDIDDFVLVYCFRLFYNENENFAKICFKKYAKYKLKKTRIFFF